MHAVLAWMLRLRFFRRAKDSLPDGRDRNAGTGVPWDDGGSVLRQYGEDTKLDLKNSSWQQRISDSDFFLLF